MSIELPAISIQTADSADLDRAILNLKRYHWIIFTSANGVAAFWQRLHDLKLDSRILGGLKVGAIGPATAEALKMNGIMPDYIPDVYTGEGLIAGLKKQDVTGQWFLLPRADIADKALAQGISQLGAEVHEVDAYHTVPATETTIRAKQMLISGEIDVITFTSSSTVSNLAATFQGEPMTINSVKVACIGPKTAETAVKVGLKVDIMAGDQTIPGLVDAIEEYFRKEI